MLLAVGLPSQYGSTATFQLKTELNDQARGDNYADRYISGSDRDGSRLPGAAGRDRLAGALSELKEDPGAALKKLQGDVRADMLTQKILDPQTGLERNINTGFTSLT